MKYAKPLSPMLLLVASSAAFAANEGMDMSFDGLDQDGDGVISRDEANATPALGENFDALDANADGVLDESEIGVGGPGTGTGEGDMGEGEAPASDDSIESE